MSPSSSGTGNTARVGVLGASGYTGGELLRLLAQHDGFSVGLLTAERRAGQSLGAVFPHLDGAGFPDLVKIEDAAWDTLDAVFCCLPHGTTQEVVAALPDRLKVVDLSADFRLADPAEYAEWYGRAHGAVALQGEAVYGLTELARDEVRSARLVANPGCYPTSAQLPLAPLLEDGLIESDDIIIDAKSGVSGAGREAKQATLFAEVGEGVHAYGIAAHRHAPEIEQGLSAAVGAPSAGQLHAPSHAHEPGHFVDDLRAQPRGRRRPARGPRPALRGRAVRARAACGRGTGDAPRAGLQPLPHRGLRRPDRGPRHPDLGHR